MIGKAPSIYKLSFKLKGPHNLRVAIFDKIIPTLAIFMVEPYEFFLTYKLTHFDIEQSLLSSNKFKMEMQVLFFTTTFSLFNNGKWWRKCDFRSKGYRLTSEKKVNYTWNMSSSERYQTSRVFPANWNRPTYNTFLLNLQKCNKVWLFLFSWHCC